MTSKFVNPTSIIAQLDIPKGSVVADLGCGSGFYTLSLAKAVGDKGSVYAVDIMPDKLAVTQSSAQMSGLKNITVILANLEQPVTEIDPGSCELVVASNIIHLVSSQSALLSNAYRMLRTGGRLLVVEWKKGLAPFGPEVATRISQVALTSLAEKHGFRHHSDLEADGYHYATVFIK